MGTYHGSVIAYDGYVLQALLAVSAAQRGLEGLNPTAESFYNQRKKNKKTKACFCCEREIPMEWNPL